MRQSEAPFMLAALPPAEASESEVATAELAPAVAAKKAQHKNVSWARPQVRLGGRFSYFNNRSTSDYGNSNDQGLMTTLMARVYAPVWQPWFGNFDGDVDLGAIRNEAQASANSYSANNSGGGVSESTFVNGKAQLSMLPLSKFPFEAHIQRSDGRSASNMSSLDSYISKSAGFSQNYKLDQGNVMFAWDENMQKSTSSLVSVGEYRQNSMRLALSKTIGPEQEFSLSGNNSRNTQGNSEQLSEQRGWVATHSLRKTEGLTVETTADTTRSLHHLQLPSLTFVDSFARQQQLNSYAVWKPVDDPLSLNGGVRVMTLDNSYGSAGAGSMATSGQMRSVNLNGGVAYEQSRNLRLTGSANINQSGYDNTQAASQQTSSSESAGVNYQHDQIAWGDYQYAFNGNATLTNNNDGNKAVQQMQGGVNHSLSRGFDMGQGSMLSSQVSQAISTNWSTRGDPSRQLTHGGMLGWGSTRGDTTMNMRLSASDARSFGANPGVFQLLNFQATGHMPSGRYGSWAAGLTSQITRQSREIVLDPSQPNSVMENNVSTTSKMSSGNVSYRNQQVFNVARLQFNSDFRIYGQALLPTLGGPQDQESSSWENWLEYTIGRLQLRLDARFAKNGQGQGINKSYQFRLTRDFGDI